MNDTFEKRVRSAAIAGWWVVLLAMSVVLFVWVAYLIVVPTRPAWLLGLWGPGVDWPFVQAVWFWGVAAFKIFAWLLFFAVLWLTLWTRQLRKGDGR